MKLFSFSFSSKTSKMVILMDSKSFHCGVNLLFLCLFVYLFLLVSACIGRIFRSKKQED